jgi:hypothetical protein
VQKRAEIRGRFGKRKDGLGVKATEFLKIE